MEAEEKAVLIAVGSVGGGGVKYRSREVEEEKEKAFSDLLCETKSKKKAIQYQSINNAIN